MAENWNQIASEAGAGIAEVGQPATINRIVNSGTDYDPVQTVTLYNCTITVMNFSFKEIDGTLVQRTDKKVYVSKVGLLIEPTTSDTITIGGIRHEIVNVMPLSPAGTIVFWQIQARI